jgi:hypothetical protein
MARVKPLSIYPDATLRNRIEAHAQERKRSLNQQILLVLERWVERRERRAAQGKVLAQ